MEPSGNESVSGLSAQDIPRNIPGYNFIVDYNMRPFQNPRLERDQDDHIDMNGSSPQLECPDEPKHQLLLACPFYKSDRGKYQDCLRLQLKRIKDVKQHISRRHMQAPFCPSCGLEFETQDQQMEHCRFRQCQVRDFSRPDGITYSQRDMISTRARRNQGSSGQWFAVWDLLFPTKPRPASAFVEHPVREAMDSLRELWSKEGLDIIAATSQRYHGKSQPETYNEHLPIAVSDAMNALFDQFLRKNPSTPPQAHVATISRGHGVAVSGWDRIQDSRSINAQGHAESLTSHFLSTPPGSIDFGTLLNYENNSVLKPSGVGEPMAESGGWGDFLAEGCNSWNDFSLPPEHQIVRPA